jgi:hypothetical protein
VQDCKKLPLYRYFGHPNGITVYNDGERLVLMKIGELWGSNHDHLDTGCFQVYCGGALASDSGMYDSYHTSHRMNYTIRTAAHNCLTVYDPEKPLYGEWKDGAAYDGGMRRPCAGKEPKTLETWRENYKMATVLSHTESEMLCEIEGDLTDAYSHTCDRVVRKMRWEPTRGSFGVLTVTDIVEMKSDEYVAAFHIHTQSEPLLTNEGIVIDNGKYSLVCRISDCENTIVEIVGGDGKCFVVDGVNYDTDYKGESEAGWGEIIIKSASKSRIAEFKVEMEIVKHA